MRWILAALLALSFTAGLAPAAEAAVVFIPIVIPIPVQVPSAQTGGYDRIHKVAVLSAIGTRLTVRSNGFFSSSTYTPDISDWKVDDRIAQMMRQYLGGRFTFKDVAFDRAALAALPNGPWDNSTGKVRDLLARVPNDDLDAFIVVRPDLEYEAPGLSGLALENGSNMFGDLAPVIWANYEIDIIDAHTYETIAKAYSRVSLRRGQPDSFAGLIGDASLKLDNAYVMNDSQRAILHGYVNRLVTASLIETLRSLQLGVTLPEPGARTLVPIPEGKQPYPNIKSVAIVSGVGDVVDFEYFATVFDRKTRTLTVPDWHLDAAVEDAARGGLDKRIAVKTANVDRAAFADAGLLDKDGKFAPSFPGLAPRDDIDAYILFVKLRDKIVGYIEGVGVGLFRNDVSNDTAAFAKYAVVLVDAHTLKPIAARQAVTSPDYADAHAYVPVDASLWPNDPPNLSADQSPKVAATLKSLLADSAAESLLSLGLAGKMVDTAPPPAPGTMAVGGTAEPAP